MQLANGAFIKKRIWDGVTGTVFNMPTKPLEPVQDPKDDKLERVKEMYGKSYWLRKPQFANSDIFPLDIRRVKRVSQSPTRRSIPPLLENAGDDLLRDRRPGNDPLPFNYRVMSKDDPWYVTDEQKDLIDYPPRRYPPPEQIYEPEIIPVDETIFREELESDQLNYTSYFATNLHGGTLIINGMEIRKGDVAGPLPKFAVIECPGGQIAFWFGSYGRHHLAGSDEDSYSKWQGLRQQKGWMYTGFSAGHVWNAKIKDRLERIKTGERENDDEQWEEWLSSSDMGKPGEFYTILDGGFSDANLKDPITSVTYRLPVSGSIPENGLPLPSDITGPHVLFPSEQYELAWILAQRELKRTPESIMDTCVLPSNEFFFPGSKNRSEYLPRKELTTEFVLDTWVDQGVYVKQLQELLVASIRDKDQREAEAELKRLESFGLPQQRKDQLLAIEPTNKQLGAAELFQLREDEIVREFQHESERQLQQGLNNESIQQLQRDWTEYTARRRAEQRSRAEEGLSALEGTTRKASEPDLSGQLSGPNKIAADQLKTWKDTHDNNNSVKTAGQLHGQSPTENKQEKSALREYAQKLWAETTTSVEPQIKVTKRPKIILNYTPKPDDTSPMIKYPGGLDAFEPRPSLVLENSEQLQLQEELELSTKAHKDNLQQAFSVAAIGALKSIPRDLARRKFSSMEEYQDVATQRLPQTSLDHRQKAFEKFQRKLRQAYEDGLRAQARLQNMEWELYMRSKAGLSPSAWLDLVMRQTGITLDDMPLAITSEMSAKTEATQRLKWSRLCDMVIDASDFEAQTEAANLPAETQLSEDGQTFAVI